MATPRVRQSGVYQIRNLVTGDLYIGSTVDRLRRWLNHKSDLRLGKHHAQHLQRSWQKHGSDAFAFEWLEDTSPNDTRVREQFYIDTLKPAYNTIPTAFTPLSYRSSEEIAAETRRLHTGRKRSTETRKRMSEAAKRRFQDPVFLVGFAARSEAQRKPKAPKVRNVRTRKPAPPKLTPEEISTVRKEAWRKKTLTTEERARRADISKEIMAKRRAQGLPAFLNVPPLSAEARASKSRKLKERVVSAETRAKLSVSWEQRRLRMAQARDINQLQMFD